jgi:catechol 2,3-dioxygenase-like lactoylglutathione lyase family enzyme
VGIAAGAAPSAAARDHHGMLRFATPVGFLPTSDLDRSRNFYEQVLGFPVTHADSFAVVVQGGGILIRLTNVGDQLRPQPFTVFGWKVPDLPAEIAEMVGRGLEFLRVAGIEQDKLGVWTAPDGNLVAWFKDPDGNILSLASRSD